MDWMNQIGNLLQPYQENQSPPANVGSDFEQFTQAAPTSVVADGLSAAFRSNATPSFGQMVAQLFTQSNGQQQAGMLNTLLAAAGPAVLTRLNRAGGNHNSLAGLLNGGQPNVTPEQAQQVPPELVKELASHAEKQDPSVVDQISNFYAQHPALVKTLGAAALGVVLTKVAQRQYG